MLAKKCGGNARFLYNRSLGAGRRDGDIDILAISASGVFVIDVKHYQGKKVEVRRTGGLFTEKREELVVGGRDQTKLLASVSRQFEAVCRVVTQHPLGSQVAVRSALCFVGAEWPLFGTLSIAGVPILGAKGASKLILGGDSVLSVTTQAQLYEMLAALLPAA
ncbi:MAG: nuclease-related domain-containing protein [Candidatus Nanopelagicales bacterium]